MEATFEHDYQSWNYLMGNHISGKSIALMRWNYLRDLNWISENLFDEPLTLSLHDPSTNAWTKWLSFYDDKFAGGKIGWKAYAPTKLDTAYEIHRSLLKNEVVIESDFPTYEENYDAMRVAGRILEERGFSPLYYYSGGKSLHCHVFFDFRSLLDSDIQLQEQVMEQCKSRGQFIKKFMDWLSRRIITCWGVKPDFDTNFLKKRQLIRAELSHHKYGYKTFLGYSYKDLPIVPYRCNPTNKLYPKIGEIRFSKPHAIQEMIQEFLASTERLNKKQKAARETASLAQWLGGAEITKDLPRCVEFILSDDFKTASDGHRRAMFILLNELRKREGIETAERKVRAWNERMGSPVKSMDISYAVKRGVEYNLSCDYVHEFLDSIGFTRSEYHKTKSI